MNVDFYKYEGFDRPMIESTPMEMSPTNSPELMHDVLPPIPKGEDPDHQTLTIEGVQSNYSENGKSEHRMKSCQRDSSNL